MDDKESFMKEINVYGTGENAVKFVLLNQDIKIASFIEGKTQKKVFMEKLFLSTVPVVPLENAENVLRKRYTIIASSENAYWEIKEILEKQYGLIEFENFEYWETFRREMVLIYGNCHTVSVKQILKLSKPFNDKYGFYPLKPVQEIKASGGVKLNAAIFNRCRIFIHQDIRKENIYGLEYASETLINKLPLDCRVIAMPNLYRMPRFMFPQMVSYENSVEWEAYNYFPFRDIYIDENHDKMGVSDIKEMMMDDGLIDKSDILMKQDLFFEKVEMRELEWDIKISAFLRKNMKNSQLFYDPNHPAKIVIQFIAYRILDLLKISSIEIDASSILPLDGFELPIYKAVSKALNLNYCTSVLRRFSSAKLGKSQMDLNEYIRQYIAWYFPVINKETY